MSARYGPLVEVADLGCNQGARRQNVVSRPACRAAARRGRSDPGQDAHVDLATRLGSPGDYATELRRSAGLPPAHREPLCSYDPTESASALPEPLSSIWSYLRSLAPAWWAIRAYLVAGLILTIAVPVNGVRPAGWHPDFLTNDAGSGPITGAGPYIVFAIAALIAISVRVGRAQDSRLSWLASQILTLVAIGTLVTCPMWWVGPSLYSYYRGRYGL